MRVRMLAGIAGPNISLAPGDEHDFDHADAARLIESGYAVPVAMVAVETAVAAPAPEQRRRGRRGKADVVSHDHS